MTDSITEIKSPSIAATIEGLSIALEANAGSLYDARRIEGKPEPMVTVPRRAIDGAVAALIAALDWADGDADCEPNGDDEPDSDAEPEDGL